MKIIDPNNGLIIKCWCNNPEEGAVKQMENMSALPFAFHHIAVMPDTHQGYGMPIGGVLATNEQIVVPNAVGVDIGCGMLALKTSLRCSVAEESLSIDQIKRIMGLIREVIPVGFDHHKDRQAESWMPLHLRDINSEAYPVIFNEWTSALKQVGTLGGGNHFIEIQKGSDGHIWFMIHSGSRNLGKKVADYHNKVAKALNEKWYTIVPANHQLAFLPAGMPEFDRYCDEMKYCVDFALANRTLMMERIFDCFNEIQYCTCEETINIAHNYARMENHFGKNVLVHRKGATSAKEGELGIIPGSQGTESYIVRGKGNPESFMSCSHGAGRAMSRTKAIETLNLEEEIKRLNDKGIVHGICNKKDLDEASGSYKDIDVVMEEQKDLVDIVVKLEPLGVIKG